jgi:hypothetical protein
MLSRTSRRKDPPVDGETGEAVPAVEGTVGGIIIHNLGAERIADAELNSKGKTGD